MANYKGPPPLNYPGEVNGRATAVASRATVLDILSVLRRHVDSDEALRKLVIDLRKSVKANQTIAQTLDRMVEEACYEREKVKTRDAVKLSKRR